MRFRRQTLLPQLQSTRLSGTGHGDILRAVALVGRTLTRSICSPNPALNHPRIISEAGWPLAEWCLYIAALYISRAPIFLTLQRTCNGVLRSREVDNTVVNPAEAIQRGEVGRPNLTFGHPPYNIGFCPDRRAIRVISPKCKVIDHRVVTITHRTRSLYIPYFARC